MTGCLCPASCLYPVVVELGIVAIAMTILVGVYSFIVLSLAKK